MDIKVDDTWAICLASGKMFIGQRLAFEVQGEAEEPEGLCLNPCYEVREVTTQVKQANGQVGLAIGQQAVPMGFLAHSAPWTIYPDAVCEVGDLHEDDRRFVVGWIKAAEQGRLNMRAERSKIALPTRQ